eukprot:7734443-Lingulodinium_polyedra.AAC.1
MAAAMTSHPRCRFGSETRGAAPGCKASAGGARANMPQPSMHTPRCSAMRCWARSASLTNPHACQLRGSTCSGRG